MKRAAEYNALDNLAVYGMTPVSDRFPEELASSVPLVPKDVVVSEHLLLPIVGLPDSYNASAEGIVPPIRNQGQCGSCWAFSTMATLSVSDAKLNHREPRNFSEQQLVDCSTASPNKGCDGGNPRVASVYLQTNGAMLDEDYPYKAVKGTCQYKADKAVLKVNATGYISNGAAASVELIKTYIYKYGIVSVLLDSSKLQSYKSGIITATSCSTSVDHAVNLIGWGKEGDTEYWIGRNSWGTRLGEKGYFRIVTGKNACGVEQHVIYAFPPKEVSSSSSSSTGGSSSNGASIFIPSSLLFLLISLFFLL